MTAGLGLALLSAAAARAEPVTLAAAVDAAWRKTQAGAAAQAQQALADAERQTAASLLAGSPALSLSERSDRWQDNTGVREREIALALPLWLPGQRSARLQAAEAESASAAQAVAAARLTLAGQLRELAWSLSSLKAEAEGASAQQRYLQTLAADVDRRVKAGDLARTDALAVDGERLNAQAEAISAQQRLQAEQQRWTALTDLAPDVVADEPDAGRAAGQEALVDSFDEVRHPQLAQLALAEEAARRQVEVARRDISEAPELSLGYRHERDARGQASRGSVTVGLRVPFGTDGRNAPLRAAAQGALDKARAEQARARAALAADWRIARDALSVAERQTAMHRERAALLRQRAALLDKSFRAGETALPDLLLAVQAAAQADAALARQLAAQGNARARLLQASGVMP